MSTCHHPELAKLPLSDPEDPRFTDLSHSWYRCTRCKALVEIVFSIERTPDYLRRILAAAVKEG